MRAPLPEPMLAKIDAYMKQGGMIIFDTKDYGQGVPTGFSMRGEAARRCSACWASSTFRAWSRCRSTTCSRSRSTCCAPSPGAGTAASCGSRRRAARQRPGRKARRVDGVSSILITSNDFAAAWALDERSQPLYPVVPGGERQREMAFRAGVNIVMYALTGNYKADQVHVPALLERLGQ